MTDADLLAVRLPYTTEIIKGVNEEITVKTHKRLDVQQGVLDFIIAEVSSEACKFNWISDQENAKKSVNVEFLRYVIRRFGWWHNDDKVINRISDRLSEDKFFSEVSVNLFL